MVLVESMEVQTQLQPAEFLILELYKTASAKAYFAVSRRGNRVIARKALLDGQYTGWKKRLREVLRTENQGNCGDPMLWSLNEAGRKSQYTFCPGQASNSKMKSLDQASNEIIGLLRDTPKGSRRK